MLPWAPGSRLQDSNTADVKTSRKRSWSHSRVGLSILKTNTKKTKSSFMPQSRWWKIQRWSLLVWRFKYDRTPKRMTWTAVRWWVRRKDASVYNSPKQTRKEKAGETEDRTNGRTDRHLDQRSNVSIIQFNQPTQPTIHPASEVARQPNL